MTHQAKTIRVHESESTPQKLQALLSSLEQQPLSEDQADAFGHYLDLLQRWNAKINLTSIREQEGILRRHFVESILCARLLPAGATTLLDYGSGAGLPGVPCAICRPELHVTLADAQAKKAAFLREVARCLQLNLAVYHGRIEAMDESAEYDIVTLRAVDHMQAACASALVRVKHGGWLAVLTTDSQLTQTTASLPAVAWQRPYVLEGADRQLLLLGRHS